MAENVLETRIQLRYGTYSEWMNSSVILKKGEPAICSFTDVRTVEDMSDNTPINTPPAIGIKIGDGRKYFYELPWVQAVAADVYSWAKTTSKPSYTATEISGLQSFIEENFHISGDVTIAPRIYQIIRGTTEATQNKYYLRYKENNEDGQWIVDTNNPIDVSAYEKIVNWIGTMADRFPTIGTFTGLQMDSKIGNLNYTDTVPTSQFVTSVSETSGVISVERAQPSFSDISGTATVEQGGTGRTSFPEYTLLAGNGTNAITTVNIAEQIDNTESIPTNRLVKQYVDTATAGLTGAMHFIGEATVVIRNGSSVNPNITGYDFTKALPGDVILSSQQEYVWDGGTWILLGDEGSYAVKGSIKDADIDPDAAISQSKIANLSNTFDTKVDKVEGKSLTSNDFTDEYKQKLDSITDSAQTNVIEHILLNGTEVAPTTINGAPKSVNLQVSEFDETSRQKLTAIEAEAQVNKVEKIIFDNEELKPDANKVITITSNPHSEHENKIESIIINGTEYQPNKDKQVNITIDQAALNLNVLEGAQVPNGATMQEVEQVEKKLQLARIAATGDIKDVLQSNDEYITLYCGSSTQVI